MALACGLAVWATCLPAAGTSASPVVPKSSPAAVSRTPAPTGGILAAICYHRFGVETLKDPYRISLARLAGQLRWLRAHGWVG
ncbi:MAG: hypothetical protein ACREKE_03190, partial [bacterium]